MKSNSTSLWQLWCHLINFIENGSTNSCKVGPIIEGNNRGAIGPRRQHDRRREEIAAFQSVIVTLRPDLSGEPAVMNYKLTASVGGGSNLTFFSIILICWCKYWFKKKGFFFIYHDCFLLLTIRRKCWFSIIFNKCFL